MKNRDFCRTPIPRPEWLDDKEPEDESVEGQETANSEESNDSTDERSWWLAGAIARRSEELGLIQRSDQLDWDWHRQFDADIEAQEAEIAGAEAESGQDAQSSPGMDGDDAGRNASTREMGGASGGPQPAGSESGGQEGGGSEANAVSSIGAGADSGIGLNGEFGGDFGGGFGAGIGGKGPGR